MQDRHRPSPIPTLANWNEEISEWELGTRSDNTYVGEWRQWDEHGRASCVRVYDEDGSGS